MRIENQHEYIISMFNNLANIDISEKNFTQSTNGDVIYFHHRGMNFRIEHSIFNDEFILSHENTLHNNKKGNHFHIQKKMISLPLLIGYLETLHNPVSMNKHKSKIDKLFEKIK